ncbi:hypothetical protein NEOLI_001822 [Neolecta irregularis DAH-3]|uniref:Mid2 domain-containing protein n=1 Tax=Neolecta irregularis (strain DAH-3) TaxID=1198029 RepID=A0A1U7LK51_NEOID|nr:hypothetical protein NEOLI_001822 [Neolecta irregularis DAH-3]|eukprot:OLL23024.1 hypothetical protein NEOLI_001822 [Neolecta irregularis DAH-3]
MRIFRALSVFWVVNALPSLIPLEPRSPGDSIVNSTISTSSAVKTTVASDPATNSESHMSFSPDPEVVPTTEQSVSTHTITSALAHITSSASSHTPESSIPSTPGLESAETGGRAGHVVTASMDNSPEKAAHGESGVTVQSSQPTPSSSQDVSEEYAPLPTGIPASAPIIPSLEANGKSGDVNSKTPIIAVIGVGGAIVSIFIFFTIFTKLKLRPSRQFKEREKSLDWSPDCNIKDMDSYRGGYGRMQ